MTPEWEYVGQDFTGRMRGWDVDGVETAYRRRWPEFKAAVGGVGPLGTAHEVPEGRRVATDDPHWHNVVMTFGYVLARAAVDGRASMLDWGGGPGHYFLLARALLPELTLDYHSRDLPRLVALGRELLPEAHFHDDDSCLERRYDLVVVSDSMQYTHDWTSLLRRLVAAADPWLFVALLPIVDRASSFVVVQHPASYGYDTSYEGWVLSRATFLREADAAGARLEREFLAPGVIHAGGAPEPALLRSFLFRC